MCQWQPEVSFMTRLSCRRSIRQPSQPTLAKIPRRRTVTTPLMHEMKDTARATVRIGFDGRVHKTFRGHMARERFEHEVRVLRYLEKRGCTFVPRLLEIDPASFKVVTTNCGRRVDQLNPERQVALFAELEQFGV